MISILIVGWTGGGGKGGSGPTRRIPLEWTMFSCCPGAVSAQKSLQGSETEMRELMGWEEWKRTFFPDGESLICLPGKSKTFYLIIGIIRFVLAGSFSWQCWNLCGTEGVIHHRLDFFEYTWCLAAQPRAFSHLWVDRRAIRHLDLHGLGMTPGERSLLTKTTHKVYVQLAFWYTIPFYF